MKVEFSSTFIKAARKLSGKMLESLKRTILEVKAAEDIKQITDCKKLVGYSRIYRIRIGDYRAIFTLEIEISRDTILFQFLTSRGEAYGKKIKSELKRIDKAYPPHTRITIIPPRSLYQKPIHKIRVRKKASPSVFPEKQSV